MTDHTPYYRLLDKAEQRRCEAWRAAISTDTDRRQATTRLLAEAASLERKAAQYRRTHMA